MTYACFADFSKHGESFIVISDMHGMRLFLVIVKGLNFTSVIC